MRDSSLWTPIRYIDSLSKVAEVNTKTKKSTKWDNAEGRKYPTRSRGRKASEDTTNIRRSWGICDRGKIACTSSPLTEKDSLQIRTVTTSVIDALSSRSFNVVLLKSNQWAILHSKRQQVTTRLLLLLAIACNIFLNAFCVYPDPAVTRKHQACSLLPYVDRLQRMANRDKMKRKYNLRLIGELNTDTKSLKRKFSSFSHNLRILRADPSHALARRGPKLSWNPGKASGL